MGHIKFKIKISDVFRGEIKPFEILGVSRNTNPQVIKNIFKKKLIELGDKQDDAEINKKRGLICLAYDMTFNTSKYCKVGEDTYKVKDIKDPFFLVTIGDTSNLFEIINKKDFELDIVDDFKRTLLYLAARIGNGKICELLVKRGCPINHVQKDGSTPLHGAAFYGRKETVQFLIDYGADPNIKNNFGSLPENEAFSNEIKEIIQSAHKDRISVFYDKLQSAAFAQDFYPITVGDSVVAQKIVLSLVNNYDEEIINKWVPSWHGTCFDVLESIAEFGLLKGGKKDSDEEEEVNVCIHHFERDNSLDNVANHNEAIFVSESIFYSANDAYAKEIASNDQIWKILIETRVRPESYELNPSTCPRSHKPRDGEPKDVEMRVPNENDVKAISITFVLKTFLESAQYENQNELLFKGK